MSDKLLWNAREAKTEIHQTAKCWRGSQGKGPSIKDVCINFEILTQFSPHSIQQIGIVCLQKIGQFLSPLLPLVQTQTSFMDGPQDCREGGKLLSFLGSRPSLL